MNDAEFLRAFLAERDVPCAGCGFNLRGLGGPTCPECGMALRLDVPRQTILDRRRGLVWTAAALMGLLDLITTITHVYYLVTYPTMGVFSWLYVVGGISSAAMFVSIIIVMIRNARRPSDELALGLIWIMFAASLASMLSWLLQAILRWL